MATTNTGASATVESDQTPSLRLDSIPTIDLRLLSQSELYALSMSSNSSSDPNRCDDVVIPKINRSVFNESAGSRKQTYSRLRLAPPNSSTSTKTTIHRRTPHLRPSHAHTSNNVNDPEQAENSQIIRILKELYKADPNFEDVVPIEVEKDINIDVPELVNSEIKRKRGRPRKHENAVFISPPTAKRMRNNTVKKVEVYDDVRDIEFVNSRGVKVNLVDLGRLEDPYGPEITRRTEGLSTQDELLGFLQGLNGQWGTTRKKRRVVDASDFGDALPKGWKLSLSIKRKEGRVWLFCRRYISPSGRQFESCKEVSMFLLSILGEENLDKPSCTQSNDCDDVAMKEASENAADLSVHEDIKRNSPVHNLLVSSASLHTDSETQVKSDIVDPIDAHVTNENKTSEASEEAPIVEKDVDPIWKAELLDKELPVPVSAENNVLMETHDGNSDYKLISASPQSDHNISSVMESKIDEVVHDLNMNGDVVVEESGNEIGNTCNVDDNEVHGTDEALDISVSKFDFCLDHEASMSIDESNGKLGSSGGTVDDKSECVLEQGTSSGSCLLSPLSSIIEKDIVGVPNGQDAVSETRVTHADDKQECVLEQGKSSKNAPLSAYSNELVGNDGKNVVGESASVEVSDYAVSEKEGFQADINDIHICSSFDELTSEKEIGIDSKSSSAVFFRRLGLDEDSVTETKKLSDSESLSLVSPSNSSLVSPKKQEPPQNLGFSDKINVASVDQVTHGFDENRFSYNIASSKVDGQNEFRSSAFNSYNMSSVGREDNVRSHSIVEEPQLQMNKEKFHIENSATNTASNRLGEVSLDDFQIFRNNESINNDVASLGNSQDGLNTGVMSFNTGKTLEFCSLVPSGNDEEAFDFQDDVTDLYNNTQESSERVLLDHFCVSENPDDIFDNKMYSTSLDGLKFDEDREMGIHELSLAFGNPDALYDADAINLEQKKDGVNSSGIPSKIEDAFDVETDLSMVNNSMIEELKGEREGSFNLTCNNESRPFSHNVNSGNSVYQGRTWEEFRSDEFRSSQGKKFMIGSGSNQQQQRNEVMPPSGMWKTGQGSQVGSGLANPHSQIQSPSGFHSFGIMSDKGEDGVFRGNERYNGGLTVNGLRSEPVEFRFLTGRSEQNLQGGVRAFPYNTGMEQAAFGSNFWMGKNVMMPPMGGGRNVVTSVCAWCRNEFHLPAMPMNPQTQGGVGSLCPSCSAGFSGQVNML